MVIIGVVIFLMSKAAFGQCTPANVTTITANGGPLETDQIDANWVELVNACTAIGGPSVHSADQDVTINSDSNTIGAFTVLGNGISLFESDPSTNVVLFEEGTVNFKDSTMVFNSDNDGVGDLTILSDTVALAFYDVSNDEVLYAGTHDFSSSALIDLATTVVNPSSVPFHDFTVNGDTVAQLIFADSSADQVDYHGVQDFSGASTLLTGGTIQSVPSATTFQRSTAGKTGLAVISNGAFNADLDLVRGDDANASIRVTQLGNNTQFIPGSSNTLFLWNPTKLDTNFEIRGDNNDDVFFVDAGTDTVQLSTTVVNPSS
ncbi:MAG: hypothetical protein HKO76_04930, partial [Acidimicrobiia bacterium]|nr:hypothetical protein [Acidimicrobiia bacterium]